MEDYVGQTYQNALESLTTTYDLSASRITVKEVKTTEYEAGTIISQTPQAGSTYHPGQSDKITFEVAVNDYINMPNLLGYRQEEAHSLLRSLGVANRKIKYYTAAGLEVKNPAADSQIVGQLPYYGDLVNLSDDTVIELYLQEKEETQETVTTTTRNNGSSSSSSTEPSETEPSTSPESSSD